MILYLIVFCLNRFNSYDGRLDRELEAVVLVMEAFQGFEDKIKYDIMGHSGDAHDIRFVDVNDQPDNNKKRLDVLKVTLNFFIYRDFFQSNFFNS